MSGMVYRVQGSDGRGPYRPGFSHLWVDDTGPNHPPIFEAFGWSVFDAMPPGFACGCGFRSLEQLRGWFTAKELRRLADLGYSVVMMRVDVVLAESAVQLVFARRSPLRNGAVMVPLSSVLAARAA